MTNAYSSYEWFLQQDLSRYAGRWVAIVGKTVVGSGTSVQKLIEETRKKYPRQKPFITKVKTKLSVL